MTDSFQLPPPIPVRDNVISVRLSTEERETIDRLAERLNMAPSRLIREFALQAVGHFVAELGLENALSARTASDKEKGAL